VVDVFILSILILSVWYWTDEPKHSIGRPVNSGAMTDIDRRRLLAVGGAALATGLAGCSLFDDTTGVPGREGDGSVEDDSGGAEGTFGPSE
jgi:hypothetical protein